MRQPQTENRVSQTGNSPFRKPLAANRRFRMTTLELPWPPSVNHYWRLGNGHFHVSSGGRAYKLMVAGVIAGAGVIPLEGDVKVIIDAFPPDRRKRDLDNLQKSTLDSLAARSGPCGLYRDDSQIKRLEATMHPYDPDRRGRVVVTVSPWPGTETAGVPVPAPVRPPSWPGRARPQRALRETRHA